MNLSADSREFIELLNSNGVEYIVAGAHSFAFHARPRYTGDLDLFVRPSIENARKLIAVLRVFGFPSDFHESDFTEPDQVIQLGRPPHRIDLLTGLDAINFDEAWASKVEATLGGVSVAYLSKKLLIKNKKAVARPQDIADIAALEERD